MTRLKVALVTTPPSVRSGIGDYTHHLLPHLAERCELEVFVERLAESDRDPSRWPVPVVAREAHELDPRCYDQVVYQLGNELSHAFMARMIRAAGGTVVQHDWVLFDMAARAFPALARGGLKGHVLAWREGGVGELRSYLGNWLDRRRQRLTPLAPADVEALSGTLLFGWHAPEPEGRWIADRAYLRLPGRGVRAVELDLVGDPRRRVHVRSNGHELASGGPGMLRAVLERRDEPLVELFVEGVRVSPEQRSHGDARRLAAFVSAVRWEDAAGRHELDLSIVPARDVPNVTLARDRFHLPFNRSIVRFADAFLVHSEYVKQRILADRNARTAIGVVHHGAQRRWRDEDRRLARRALGLDEAWQQSFLVISFGGVQPHKRIDRALEALALARRRRDDVRLVLAGRVDGGEFDPVGLARRLGIEHAVHFTGFVSEDASWDWLHAGDLALNLRGPTSGGTSGGIFRAFSVGRTVLVSDAGEQSELPDECVVKVPLGKGEVEGLADALVALRDEPEGLRQREAAVRRFVDAECHWSHVAARYVEHLEGFPRPKLTRRQRIHLRMALSRALERRSESSGNA